MDPSILSRYTNSTTESSPWSSHRLFRIKVPKNFVQSHELTVLPRGPRIKLSKRRISLAIRHLNNIQYVRGLREGWGRFNLCVHLCTTVESWPHRGDSRVHIYMEIPTHVCFWERDNAARRFPTNFEYSDVIYRKDERGGDVAKSIHRRHHGACDYWHGRYGNAVRFTRVSIRDLWEGDIEFPQRDDTWEFSYLASASLQKISHTLCLTLI